LWFAFFLTKVTHTTKMCYHNDYFCEGLVRGAFIFLNSMSGLLGLVLFNLRKKLGISLREALGLV
jgi:hypothetical protein